MGDTGELSDPYFLVSKVLSKSDSIFIQKSNRIAVFFSLFTTLETKRLEKVRRRINVMRDMLVTVGL